MKLLIAHLSDIHLRSATDEVLFRAESIAKAIVSWSAEIHLCVLAVTGDVAHAGLKEQYELAEQLFNQIVDNIKKSKDTLEVLLVAVPGNHDCNFDIGGQLRQMALDRIAAQPGEKVDQSVVDQCTLPQGAYFEWEQKISFGGGARKVYVDKLSGEFCAQSGGERVVFYCFNTAWASQCPERSVIPIPQAMLPEAKPDAVLSISLFHHPYPWMEPNSGKTFRKEVEHFSDVILTGHEHDPDQVRKVSSVQKSEVTYIEGGLLQDSHTKAASSFNLVLLDSGKSQQKCATFEWSGDHYSTSDVPEWQPFSTNPARPRSGLALKAATVEWIQDPQLDLGEVNGTPVRLEEFFVFPDLREFTLPGARGSLLNVSV